MTNSDPHQSVMLTETISLLNVQTDGWYIDGTFGRGGHTQEIMKQGGRVIALDFDEQAIEAGKLRFKAEISNQRLILLRQNFADLSKFWPEFSSTQTEIAQNIQGAIFDFGTSIEQLKHDDQRGFSFTQESAKLDMRMDNRLGVTASDLLKVLPEKQLISLFQEMGGEQEAKAIAKKISQAKLTDPTQLETVGGLVQLILKAKRPNHFSHLHPATKVFQALRIAVNDEMDNIQIGLPQILDILTPKSRLVTIAFHEGEDRIAKHLFTKWSEAGRVEIITPKPLKPSETELATNPRSRSAKLRAVMKIK